MEVLGNLRCTAVNSVSPMGYCLVSFQCCVAEGLIVRLVVGRQRSYLCSEWVFCGRGQ